MLTCRPEQLNMRKLPAIIAQTLTSVKVNINPKKQCQNIITYQGTSDIMRLVKLAIETSQANNTDKITPSISLSDYSSSSVYADLPKTMNITPPKASTMLRYSNLMIFSFRKITAKIELQNGLVCHNTICRVRGIKVTMQNIKMTPHVPAWFRINIVKQCLRGIKTQGLLFMKTSKSPIITVPRLVRKTAKSKLETPSTATFLNVALVAVIKIAFRFAKMKAFMRLPFYCFAFSSES